ncbi:TorF family putative porin [Herminiimonas aquatilis]|uniref:TorF family putative porin n=1 Tax=Herminiimonas aquatilis TaxID=345342 RepID=A0ABW2J831_9BURK
MKKLIVVAAITAAFTTSIAHAQEHKSDSEVSFNAGVTSDYRFRGISQTRLEPALQGGADYVHNPSGFYAGTWLSTIKFVKDAGGSGSVEIDVYGGKRGAITEDVSYDVGVLTYVYPSNDLNPSANTTELYAQLGYGPAYIKYSYSVTDLFGYIDSEGSGYLDAGMNLEVGKGFILNLHAGHQTVKGSSGGVNNDRFSYTDWKIGVTKDFGIATGALAVIGTNADKDAYASPVNAKFMGKTALVLTVSKTF